MNYFAIGPTIVAVFVIVLGLFVFLKKRENKLNTIYFYLSISLFIWLICFSIMYWNTGNYDLAYLFAKIGFIGVILTPVCVLHFTVKFLNSSLEKYTLYFYLSTIPVIIINFSSHLMYSGLSINFWGYYPIAGSLYFIALGQFIGTFSIATVVLFRHFRESTIDIQKREQIKYLMMAFAIALLASGDYIIKYPNINFYPFGYIVVIFFSFIMGLNAVKNNLMDIRLVITRTLIFGILYSIILLFPMYLGFKTGRWLLAYIILFLLSTVGQVVAKYFQTKAEKYLLYEQEQYQQLLIQASKGMIQKDYNIDMLSKLIVRILKRSVKIQFVSLYLFDEEKNIFKNVEYRGNEKRKLIDFPKNYGIIEFMKKIKKPFFPSMLKDEDKSILSKVNSNISLIIPSIFKDNVIGFLLLGDKENRTLYSPKDIEVFSILSNQAALAIENCKFLEKSQKQQKRLFEAEKLASIGGMADGLAHQIKNRLNNFSLIGGELSFELGEFREKYKEFVEKEVYVQNMLGYIEEMADSIMKNVNKTNLILKGVLSFAKSDDKDKFFSVFSFKDVVEQSVNLVKIKHHKSNIKFVCDIPEQDNVYGVKVQIQEAVFNCIDNAYEAILEKIDCIKNPLLHEIKIPNIDTDSYIPQITISLKYVSKKVKITIQDNGIGIEEKNKAKIFSAFFTTKVSSKSGSGIGSYVVKRMIVENHKGSINFKSKYGVGTTFEIVLPIGKKVDIKDN